MFKVGDQVVCISNTSSHIILLKTYSVVKIMANYLYLENEEFGFYAHRFELLSEHRKKKLLKLKEKCYIKKVI